MSGARMRWEQDMVDDAIAFIGECVGPCEKCCSALTDGDICEDCYKVHAGLVSFGREMYWRGVRAGAGRAR